MSFDVRPSRRVLSAVSIMVLCGLALALIASPVALRAQSGQVDKHQAELSGVVEIAKSESAVDVNGQTGIAALARPAGFKPSAFLEERGRNIRVNQDFSDFAQNETMIAINPTNRRNIVAGANDYRLGYVQSGFYSSMNGGRTWYDGLIPIPSWPDGDVPDGGGDPVVLFDSNGTVYYFGLAFERANGRNALVVSRSTNGGRTWSRHSFVSGDGVVVANLDPADMSVFHDKEWATIDLTDGQPYSHHNRIYVTWTHFDPSGSPIYEAHSDDGGATWSSPHAISGASVLCDYVTPNAVVAPCVDNQPSWPVVGPDGTVYVFFRNVDTVAENQYLLVKSTDGGVTWSDPVKVADIFDINYPLAGLERPDCTARGQEFGRRVLTNSCFRANSYGGPAVAPDGMLYLVWSDNRHGDAVNTDTDIFLSRSSDGGATWSAPIRVNDDPIGNDQDQFFPWVAVAPNGGVVVIFHDRRLDPANFLVDTWVAASMDKGEHWKNIRVSNVSSNFDYAFRGGIFVGDYNGIAVTDQASYPFFTDARNGTATLRQSDVFLARLELDD